MISNLLESLADGSSGGAPVIDSAILSRELTQTFLPETIATAVEQALAEHGKITSVEYENEFQLSDSGEWLSGKFTLTTSTGTAQSFLVVFHLEDNVWKLFGTIEL